MFLRFEEEHQINDIHNGIVSKVVETYAFGQLLCSGTSMYDKHMQFFQQWHLRQQF